MPTSDVTSSGLFPAVVCRDEVTSSIVYRGDGTYRYQLILDYGEAESETCIFPAPVEVTLNADGSAHAAITYYGYAAHSIYGEVWCSPTTGNTFHYFGTHENGEFTVDMGNEIPPLTGTYDALGIVGTWEHNYEVPIDYPIYDEGTQYHNKKLFFSVGAIFSGQN